MLTLGQAKLAIVLVFVHFFDAAASEAKIVIEATISRIKLRTNVFRFGIGIEIGKCTLWI